MTSLSMRWWALVLTVLLALCISCSGGGNGGGTTPPPGEAFDLLLTADPDTGTSPLTVSFFVVASGGVAPYLYAWDFDTQREQSLSLGSVIDSNAPSGTWTYTATDVAKITVTDARGLVVTAQKSILVTGPEGPPPSDQLDVRFNASPQMGNVPFNVQFEAFVSGGKAPYSYSWDFNGDAIPDSFLVNPRYTYEKIGTKIDASTYVFYPVLTVTDSRGVTGTNLDDKDNNGSPDFKVPINALPPEGGMIVTAYTNPDTGQAPLTVEFTGAVTGGSNNYEYRWTFGDGGSTEFSPTSISTHTYLQPGTYLAYCFVHDITTGELVSSVALTINATPEQTFQFDIQADVQSAQVPFVVNLQVVPAKDKDGNPIPITGQEPITYQWDVFDDLTPADAEPSIVSKPPDNSHPIPSLNDACVVTPDFTFRKNPTIHFANTGGQPSFSYVVRCVATDKLGNVAVGKTLLRVVASPNTTYPFYEAQRPLVVGSTSFPVWTGAGDSGNAVYNAFATPQTWGARANPAICSHPTGITFVIGGEIVDENGQFERLVDRSDSMYAFVPAAGGTGTGENGIGGYNPGNTGTIIRLNDDTGPAFPNSPTGAPGSPEWPQPDGDTTVPPVQDPQQPAAQAPGAKSLRSAPFNIVGSGAAVFMHEAVETNPLGSYPGPGVWADVIFPNPGDSIDRDVVGFPSGALWAWPDCPIGWSVDNPQGPVGLGTPVIYVLGGRTDASTPTDLVQKYYVWGFGNEFLVPWSQDFQFQNTGNQVDIWSPYFARPDQDQFTGSGVNFDPQIDQRQQTDEGELPHLHTPLYGLMACKVESSVDAPTPDFPNGAFKLIYVFGGIDDRGAVSAEMRVWNPAIPVDNNTGDEEVPGLFSLVSTMPSPRAYGQAVFIPYGSYRIALVGGINQTGAPLNTVDVFTFGDNNNPGGGTWETFVGTLPDALEACGAGFIDRGEPTESWILAFSGWTGERYSHSVYNSRLDSPGNLVIREPVVTVPRAHMGSSQAGSRILSAVRAGYGGSPVDYNRYYLVGGVDENGTESIVEVVSLP